MVRLKVMMERDVFWPFTPRKSKNAIDDEMPAIAINDSCLHDVKRPHA